MTSSLLTDDGCKLPDQKSDRRCAWIELQSEAELNCVIAELFQKLTACRCPPDDQLAIRTALESAIFHAFRHGSRLDPNGVGPNRKVRLYFYLSEKYLIATIKNVGRAFTASPLPDQANQENLPYESGLFLIRRYMTWVRFNGLENSVTMCKSWYGARS